jgi:hypothetical protein
VFEATKQNGFCKQEANVEVYFKDIGIVKVLQRGRECDPSSTFLAIFLGVNFMVFRTPSTTGKSSFLQVNSSNISAP